MRPVAIDGRILIDGGTTNPLPFDRLRGSADRIVAVDVLTAPPTERGDIPGAWESVIVTLNIMGSAIIAGKLAQGAPDLVIRPERRDLSHARFLSGDRDPAGFRGGEGGSQGATRRAVATKLAPFPEKALQQDRRFSFRQPAIDLGAVMAGR